MTDQTPDPWEGVPLAIRREVFECATSNGRISPEYLGGLYRRGAQARTVVDHDGEVLTQAAVDRLLLERAQHQQALIDQRAIGHGEGQEHAIADVNAGRIDDLIAPRLAQRDETIRQLQEQSSSHRAAWQAAEETVRWHEALVRQQAEQIEKVTQQRDSAIDESIRLTNTEIEALSARCATLTAALEQAHEWMRAASRTLRTAGGRPSSAVTLHTADLIDAALSGVSTP